MAKRTLKNMTYIDEWNISWIWFDMRICTFFSCSSGHADMPPICMVFVYVAHLRVLGAIELNMPDWFKIENYKHIFIRINSRYRSLQHIIINWRLLYVYMFCDYLFFWGLLCVPFSPRFFLEKLRILAKYVSIHIFRERMGEQLRTFNLVTNSTPLRKQTFKF